MFSAKTGKYYKKGENFEKKVFMKNAKTPKSIAHEILKLSKILFFSKNEWNRSEKIRVLQRTWSHVARKLICRDSGVNV
ncbi:hypothetical protein T10_7342 [Trichinella papuae]|uniref:Uncharacterized protein n=1 Tax=Trichinella papuae TaxID=268474 RepID=A0A0V1MST3_9BILA|nr:hypothetical protein T10_7342 [Trichinella papuae]